MPRIKDLTTKTGNLSSADQFVSDNGTAVTKIDYTALAKAIIEQYNGSTLAGSAQSVQAALNSLNSNLTDFAGWRTGGSFNNYRRTGMFVINSATEAPSTAVSTYALIVVTSGSITSGTDPSTVKQIAFTVNGTGWWTRQYVGGNWSAWTQM